MTRILIADDHEIVRRAVRHLLEQRPEWQVCADAATGQEAVRLSQELRPDIVILDLSMPDISGVEVTQQLRESLPDTKIIVLSMHDSEVLTRQALAAGAHGYLLKSDAAAHIERAIEALLQGKGYFTPGIAATLVSALVHGRAPSEPPNQARLTTREREILRLLAEGISNKAIARQLDLAVPTVQTHRAAIMRKLKVSSLAGLVRYAVRNGVVDA